MLLLILLGLEEEYAPPAPPGPSLGQTLIGGAGTAAGLYGAFTGQNPLAAVGLIGSTLEKVMGGGEDGEDGADGEGKKTTVVSLDEPTMKQLASMVADAVSSVEINTEVSSDIWGSGNRNGKGTYQGKVKNQTALV